MSNDETVVPASVRANHFGHLRADVAHLNHGSFGAAPTCILDKATEWARAWQGACDYHYYNHILLNAYKASINALGPIVNSKEPYPDHLALIDNATSGANIVAQAVMWKFITKEYNYGDVILMWECAYGAVQYVFHHHLDRLGARIIKVPVPFPLNHLSGEEANEKLVEAFHWGIKAAGGSPIRLVVLEHVASETSMVFPLRRLVQLCRSHPEIGHVFVDADHAIGNVPIDLVDFDVDYYVSNCHKWFFTPQSCAFFYSKEPFETKNVKALDLHNPVISWQLNKGLMMESYHAGTRNLSEKLVIPDVVQFLSQLSSDAGLTSLDARPADALKAIQDYNHSKVVEYARLLAEAWGTSIGTPPELMSSMGMVELPPVLGIDCEAKRDALRLVLINRFNLSIALGAVPCDEVQANGTKKRVIKGYTRIAHQIYVAKEDVERFRDAILDLVKEQ